jgi:hypothetical protein
MAFVRLIILIAAALTLAGVGPSPRHVASDRGPSDVALLLAGDDQDATKSLDNLTTSPHHVSAGLAVETAPALPEPTCHPTAERGHETTKLKHAYSSEYSGLNPPA